MRALIGLAKHQWIMERGSLELKQELAAWPFVRRLTAGFPRSREARHPNL